MRLTVAYREVARERGFRRFLLGEGVSSLGDAMSEVGVVMLALAVADAGQRPVAVALATAAYLVPGIVSGVLTGGRLDRWAPRTLLFVDSVWRGGWLAAASVLAVLDLLHVWTYVALLGVASLSRPLGAAGGRAILPQLLADDRLFTGNSMVQAAVQVATTVGPALAGIVVAAVGPGVALGLDALSFLFYAGVLLTLPRLVPHTARPTDVTTVAADRAGASGRRPEQGGPRGLGRAAGWMFRWEWQPVTALFVITAVMLVLYGPFVVGLPILAQDRAGGLSAATTLGLLWSVFGLGTVVGGLVAGGIASLATTRVAALITGGWGLCVLVVGVPAPIVVAGLAMLAGGVVYAPYNAITYTVMQRTLPPHRLVAAAAYFDSMKSIAVPAGILVGGVTIAAWGPARSMIVAGALLAVLALLLALPAPVTAMGGSVDRGVA